MMPPYIVTCRFCGAANRVSVDKEGKIGRCGACRKELLPLYYRPLQLTDTTLESFVARYGGLIVVEFWAPSCPHCRSFEATVQKTAGLLAGSAAVVQVNTQENPVLASRFSIRSIPVLIALKQGKPVDQLPGAQSSAAIMSWLQRYL